MGSASTKIINPQVEEFVKNTIANERVVIFSKLSCPYCRLAKSQFEKLNANYVSIEIDKRPDCSEIQDVLHNLTGERTVPRVFVNGNFIGGGTDVKKLYENGELIKLIS